MKSKFPKSIEWTGSSLNLLDQRKIPFAKEFIEYQNLEDVIEAIRLMIVRGAPAIALSGMYGLTLYLLSKKEKPSFKEFSQKQKELLDSRPTAVNLRLALEEYSGIISEEFFKEKSIEEIQKKSEEIANRLFAEDLETNRKISKHGADLFGEPRKLSLLTHCNTGAIATAGIGTAIGIFRELRNRGFDLTVFAGETRPYHQGSRLTAWEMGEENINCYIITDSMAGWLMNDRKIDAVVVGADRIASNGDTANKIGTYSLSILAKEHKVPFYVACSKTSFDFKIETGKEIKIEMRPSDELTQNSFLKDETGEPIYKKGILAPINAKALNPSFDVTPHKNIKAIIMEKGVIDPITPENISSIVNT
ncbi:MAG: S-methyl-5-thioribose-1-phosphate isomerase [Leptospiraceae bacterium]|nr:S-methyl-5-thioribose-1-phosphate isomerase [Leptospiraceae bacterium]